MSLKRLALVVVALTAMACGRRSPPGIAEDGARARCATGAYRSATGDILAISTPASGGFRYTFLDGRRGLTTEDGAVVRCAGESVLVTRGDGAVERWAQVPLRVTSTRFSSAGATLAGMLLEPAAPGGAPPLVVMAHGSEDYAWLPATQAMPFLLAAQGISTFMFDKHGTGASEGRFHMNFQRLANDLVAASAEARRLARGRFGRFGLHGGSQGGWTVPLAARAAGAEFIVISYGGVFSPQEEDSEQVLDELRTWGYGEDVLEKARVVTRATGAIMTSNFQRGFDELARARAAFGGEPWFNRIQGEFTGDLIAASPERLRSMQNEEEIPYGHDAAAALRENLFVPTLWVLAEKDREAPGQLTEERLAMLIAEGKPIQVVVFPDTDHGIVEFVEAADGTRRYTRVTDGYYRLVADWIKGTHSPPYGRGQSWPAPMR